jgi:hypothetical protein
MSLLLFSVVTDLFAILLVARGLGPNMRVIYIIVFMEHNLEEAVNIKLILCSFQQLSYLNINFHDSEIFSSRNAKAEEDWYKEIFECEPGYLPSGT